VAAALGSALLVVKAVGTAAGRGVVGEPAEPVAVVAAIAVAALSLGATASVFALHGLAPRLLGGSLVAALVIDYLPTAPPRLLPWLLLLVALALLVVRPPAATAGDRTPAAVARVPPGWQVAAGWLALVLHVLVGFPYLVSGLVAPGSAVVTLLAIWTGLLVLLLRLRPTRPLLALLVPPAALAIWYAVLALGGALLGWSP